MNDLKKLQRRLEESVASKPGVTGVGIGLNDSQTDYVFRILLESEKHAKGLPSHIDDVEVKPQVTGRIKAL